ncbi:MAG: MFS transporter, partial [Planctomycetaceae bacterium]|nr:MFS transporter [Planctomycetaceae bacterium]
ALLSSRSFWGLAGQAFFKAAGYNFSVTFFPAMLEFAYETPREMTGTLASGSMVGLVVGSLVGGWTIDSIQRRTNNKRLSRCGIAAISLVGTGCVMLMVPVTDSARSLAVLLGAAAFVSGFAQSPPWAAIIDIGGKQTAVAMGFMNCASSLPGIVISPLTGKLMDHIRETEGDWNLLIYLHAAFYLAAASCWLFVNPYKSIESQPDGTSESTHAV